MSCAKSDRRRRCLCAGGLPHRRPVRRRGRRTRSARTGRLGAAPHRCRVRSRPARRRASGSADPIGSRGCFGGPRSPPPPTRCAHRPAAGSLVTARERQLHDALYVALAVELGAPLVTLDARLAAAPACPRGWSASSRREPGGPGLVSRHGGALSVVRLRDSGAAAARNAGSWLFVPPFGRPEPRNWLSPSVRA